MPRRARAETGEPTAERSIDVRAHFPGASYRIHLDVASAGLLSRPVRNAIERHLDAHMLGSTSKPSMRATVECARARFARLVGGHPDEVAITKNVSEGLNLFASSLPWDPADNVVLCPGLEHPNNVWLWYNLKRIHGIEVRTVEPENGRIPVAGIAEAIDEHTRVVTVPHVSFVPGFITDVAAVAQAAHRRRGGTRAQTPAVRAAHGRSGDAPAQNAPARGPLAFTNGARTLVLVDAAQSAGALRIDVGRLGADALVTTTQKALHSVYGFGFLWIRREIALQLVPAHLARYGVDSEDLDETALDEGDRLRYQPGARRFDLGNYNYLGATAAEAALALIEDTGIEAIEAHVRGLAARLARGLIDLGLPVFGGEPGSDLAHIVCVGPFGQARHDALEDPALAALHESLASHGVRLSARRGMLRFSVALHNRAADIDRVIEIAGEWAARRDNAG